jgi:hypothetical protein
MVSRTFRTILFFYPPPPQAGGRESNFCEDLSKITSKSFICSFFLLVFSFRHVLFTHVNGKTILDWSDQELDEKRVIVKSIVTFSFNNFQFASIFFFL